MLLNKDLVRVHESFSSQEEAILAIGSRFVDAGVAKPSFPQAVLDRERVYPTGLPAQAFDIALCHCDSEHVVTSAIGLSVLEEPLEFQMMGSPEEGPLHVIVIFMLAIKDPKAQVPTLQKMMRVIQSKGLLEQVREARTAEEVFDLLAPELEE